MKLTKLSFLMVGVFLLFGSTFGGVDQAFAQQQFIRGDADGDCLVGVLDVYFLTCYKYVPGSPPPPCMEAADVYEDGVVNVSDIMYLINYLFVCSDPPPHLSLILVPTPTRPVWVVLMHA